MRLFLRLEDEQKSCAIGVVYLLRVTLGGAYSHKRARTLRPFTLPRLR